MSTLSTYEMIRNQLFLTLGLSIAAGQWFVGSIILFSLGHYAWGAGSFLLWAVFCIWLISRQSILLRLIQVTSDLVDLEIKPETGK